MKYALASLLIAGITTSALADDVATFSCSTSFSEPVELVCQGTAESCHSQTSVTSIPVRRTGTPIRIELRAYTGGIYLSAFRGNAQIASASAGSENLIALLTSVPHLETQLIVMGIPGEPVEMAFSAICKLKR